MRSQQAMVVPAGGGRVISGLGAHCKVPAAAFEGRFFMFEAELPPAALIPSHTHTHEDEVTVVVAGELSVALDGVVSTAGPGSVVIKPRGISHSMWNATAMPVKVLECHIPGLLEPYYDAVGKLFAAPNPDEPRCLAALEELHAQYGILYHASPVGRPS